jgi:hypothetical protein
MAPGFGFARGQSAFTKVAACTEDPGLRSELRRTAALR